MKLFKKRRKSKPTAHDPLQALRAQLPDASNTQISTIQKSLPYTMTSPERLLALCNAVEHLVSNKIPGDIVECGVWRGGSISATAQTLIQFGETDRRLWLYDTFEGMSEPTADDVDCWGHNAKQLLDTQDREDAKSVWCVSSLDEVKNVVSSTGYPSEKVEYVVGKVEETLLNQIPDQIALLRLDTDWYESTKCELEKLFPKLVDGGILIVDDYGHWEGCRKAVDEYFKENSIQIFLNRIDYTGRIGIKLPQVTSHSNSQKLVSNVA